MIKKFDEMLFENNEEVTKEVGEERVPEPKKETEIKTKEKETPSEKKEEVDISETIHTFNDFIFEGEGGGAYATNGNSASMGAITAPTMSDTPGDVAGSISGSGDIPAYDMGKKFDTIPNKKKKKKSKLKKESRHQGTNLDKENMYVTSFSDWVDNDITN